MSVATSELDGSIVGFSQIWLVLFVDTIDSIPAGKPKVYEPNLFLAPFAESQKQVGTFDVGVHVLFVMNIFKNVDDPQ